MRYAVGNAGLFLLVFLGVGCTLNMVHTSLGQPQYLPEQKGFVTVQVVSNAGRLTPLMDSWDYLALENLDNPEAHYRFERVWTGFTGSDFFVGALPPGRYRLKFLNSAAIWSDQYHTLHAPLPDSLGTFTVEVNHFTNLGTLVLQPFAPYHGVNEPRQFPFAMVRMQDRDDYTELVASLYPWVPSSADTRVVHGWDQEKEPSTPAARIVKQHTAPGRAVRLNGGEFVLPSSLGQLYWFDTDTQAWQRVDTGVVHKLEHVAKTKDGLIAVGERGLVMISDGWSEPWSRIPGPGAGHKIQWVYQHSDGSNFILTRTVRFIHLLRSPPDSEGWEEIRRFSVDYDRRFRGRLAAFAYSEDERLVVFVDRGRHELSFDGEILDKSRSLGVWDMAKQSNGIIVVGTMPGFNRPRYSRDGGLNWIKADSISEEERLLRGLERMLYVDDDGNEWMVSNKAQMKGDVWLRKVFPHEPRLRRMDRASGQLVWHGVLPAGCEEIDPVMTGPERIYVRCGDGGLVSSANAGEDWEHELIPLHASSSVESVDFRHLGTVTYSTDQVPTMVVPTLLP